MKIFDNIKVYSMDIMFYPRINDATNKAGKCSIYCKININSLCCVPFSTDVKVIAKNWNAKRKTTNDEFSDTVRQELNKIENNLRKIKIELEERNEPVTAETVKLRYQKLFKEQSQKNQVKTLSLQEIYDILTDRKMKHGASESTLKHDYFLAKCFLDFAKKAEIKDIKPYQVTTQLIQQYIDNFQFSKNYLRQSVAFLEKSLDYAVRNQIISKNQLKGYIEIPKGGSKKTSEIGLNLKEIEILKNGNFNNPEQRAVDVFLFMCGTGLDFCDYNRLTSDDIIQFGKRRIVNKKRQKTERYDKENYYEQNAIMKDVAIEILDKYGSAENLPRFKFVAHINSLLKKVGKKTEINHVLTTKRARKTFANLSINYENHSDEQTAYQLGHASTKQLSNYRRYNQNILLGLVS